MIIKCIFAKTEKHVSFLPYYIFFFFTHTHTQNQKQKQNKNKNKKQRQIIWHIDKVCKQKRM